MSRFLTRRTELGLLILGAVVLTVMLASLELSQGNVLSTDMLWLIGGFIAVFAVAHVALLFFAPQADQLMLPVAALLNGVGLVMIHRLDLATGTSMAGRR